MPNRDGTGPEGKGSKTGRQMGNCKGTEPQPGFGPGRGTGPCGRGKGCGRGFQRRTIQEETKN